ncbi:MAG: 50S ribosomal protein L29 [Anaerolineae bacterium]|nr:50S ribosomal protein L29 [Anaerolineae bacterium]
MLARDFRKLTDEQLAGRLEDSYRELFNLRQGWYMGQMEDNNRIIAVKRDIARIKTVLRERELAAMIMEGGAQ